METALIVLALALIFIVVIQIARTSELLSTIKGEGVVSKNGNNLIAISLLVYGILFLVLTTWSAFYYMDLMTPVIAAEEGQIIWDTFILSLVPIVIVFFITQFLLFAFAYKYRAKEGKTAFYFPHNNKLEVIWTAVPAIVLTILVANGIENWNKITDDPSEDAHLVEATGQQFSWIIRYPGKDGELGERQFELIDGVNTLGINWEDPRSNDDFFPNDIVLKVGQEVQFKLGAKDVLHNFNLPHFNMKMDCVPGIPTRIVVTPTMTTKEAREIQNNPDFNFELTCAELCGSAHWNMRKKVIILEEAEYNQWLSEQIPIKQLLGISEGIEEKEQTEVVSIEATEGNNEQDINVL